MKAPDVRRLAILVALLAGALAVLTWWAAGRESGLRTTVATTTSAPAADASVELAPSHQAEDGVQPTSARRPFVQDSAASAYAPPAKATGEILGVVRSRLESQRVEGGSVRLVRPPRDASLPKDPTADSATDRENTFVVIQDGGVVHITDVVAGSYRMVVDAEDFERREQFVLVRAGEVANVDVILEPVYAMKLALVLHDESGANLSRTLRKGKELESASALQFVFLESCPVVGAELPPSARRLVQKTRSVRDGHREAWVVAGFKKPTSGCACVVLGGRVLAAEPFVAGQETLVLRLKSDEVRSARSALEIVVLEQVGNAPVPDVTVTLTQQNGHDRVLSTNERGIARADDLLPGEVHIQIQTRGYARESRRVMLALGAPPRVETLLLTRTLSIRGRVNFPASGELSHTITAARVDFADGERNVRSIVSRTSRFEIQNLVPGEYAVGILTTAKVPDPERIRRNEIECWKIVDLRHATFVEVEFDLTESIAEKVRAHRAR